VDEYLRIIYGAEYSLEEHLSASGGAAWISKVTGHARICPSGSSLERFVSGEPLLRPRVRLQGASTESEPVDPRL
jgi:hypothetical protein